jgi:hypothetical protein
MIEWQSLCLILPKSFLMQKNGNNINGYNNMNETLSSLLLSSLDGVSNTDTFIYSTYTVVLNARVAPKPVLECIIKYTSDFYGTVDKACSFKYELYKLWKCSYKTVL